MPDNALREWESNTERRIGILEKKMDEILSPRDGIYPALNEVRNTIAKAQVKLLTGIAAVLVTLVANIVLISLGHK